MKTTTKTICWVLGTMLAPLAAADSLASYRAALKITEKAEAAATARIVHLRRALKTDAVGFAWAQEATGPFRKPEASSDNGRKHSATALFKAQLDDTVRSLKEEENRKASATFDPSWFLSEADAAKQARRREFCEKRLGAKFPQLVEEYAGYLAKRSQPGYSYASDAAAARRMEERRRAMTAHYLQSLQPKDQPGGTIESKIGGLERLEFVDGQTTQMLFVKRNPAAGNAIAEALPTSLSMLATYRSGEDPYFVAILSCFEQYVTDRAEDRRPGKEPKEKLLGILRDLREKLAGARQVTLALDRLSKPQVNFLIDMFLQMAGTEVPGEDEMATDFGDGKAVPSLPSYVFAFDEANRNNPAKAAELQGKLLDYRFYKLQHEQLFRLEDALESEAKMSATTDRVLKDIKNVRGNKT